MKNLILDRKPRIKPTIIQTWKKIRSVFLQIISEKQKIFDEWSGCNQSRSKEYSKIGKEKYTKIKGLSVHYCAAYVINRRGMGFVD